MVGARSRTPPPWPWPPCALSELRLAYLTSKVDGKIITHSNWLWPLLAVSSYTALSRTPHGAARHLHATRILDQADSGCREPPIARAAIHSRLRAPLCRALYTIVLAARHAAPSACPDARHPPPARAGARRRRPGCATRVWASRAIITCAERPAAVGGETVHIQGKARHDILEAEDRKEEIEEVEE